ncbi:MAG TPA: methyltransferase domain-containing protein [Vicinamibacterales bacterium]|nr:methyltransferase domain-containing protein [Vicinamibacterales bacterium]
MISDALIAVAQCPDCRGAVARGAGDVICSQCGRVFAAGRGYLDLRPLAEFKEQTKYLDEALHADARHESIAPPLLGSKIRNDRLRAFLDLKPGDRVIDLGCGSGRAIAWNADTGASLAGVDVSPFFAPEAIESSDLLLGDLRRLPIRDRAFTKAWSLDVLEHLSPSALREMLAEANRVLVPGGALFVYTHVRKNGPLGPAVRGINRFARFCEQFGLIDLRQERLRKSDHLNPIADHDELARVVGDAGFTIERLTYYTPIAGALIENVLIRMGERALARRAKKTDGATDDAAAVRAARTGAQARIRKRGATYQALRALSAVMALDVHLFGRVKSGPFFALLRKRGG